MQATATNEWYSICVYVAAHFEMNGYYTTNTQITRLNKKHKIRLQHNIDSLKKTPKRIQYSVELCFFSIDHITPIFQSNCALE